MKIRFLRTGIVSTVFLLLIILAVAVLRPAYSSLTDYLENISEKYTDLLKEKTGLEVEYKSMSPSVFTGINLSDITIYDSETKTQVAHIHKANVSYGFWNLISSSPLYALKEVVVEGVTIEVERDIPAYEKILELLRSRKKNPEKKTENKEFVLEDLNLELPFRVIAKNIALHYSDQKNDIRLSVNSATLGEQNMGRGMQIRTSGQIQYRTELVKTDNYRSLIACGFSVSGTLLNSLEGSSANIRFLPVNSADYTISRIDTLMNYSDSTIHTRTVRSLLPCNVTADFKPATGDFDLRFDAQNLDVSSFIRAKNHTGLYAKIYGSRTTCSAFVKKEGEQFNYGLKGNLVTSENLLKTPVNFEFDIGGNNKIARIRKLSATGEALEMDLTLDYDIAKRQPSGVLSVDHLILKNGGVISTELYIDPMQQGFMCFSPQVFFDDRSLTALQLVVIPEDDSYDFTFDVDDYSHAEYERNGHVNIAGSYFGGKQKVFQASVKVSDVFADSIVRLGAFFTGEEKKAKLEKTAASLAQYITTNEIYISTDFKDYSYNMPVCVFASTKNDRQILVFGIDGSRDTIQLNRFDLLFGNNSASAVAAVELTDGFREFTFTSDLTVNSLPYRFAGNYSSQWLNISGDYDFNASVSLEDENFGSLSFVSLPVAFGKNILALSGDVDFYLGGSDGFTVNIGNISAEDASGSLLINPKIVLSGSASKYGLILDTISYTDNATVQQGSGSILWNLNDGIFDSIHGGINTSSPLSSERIDISVDFSNPGQMPFSVESLKNDFYLSSTVSLNSFALSRFSSEQGSDDVCTAEITATGTLSNPFVNINLQKFTMSYHGYPVEAKGNCVFDDTGININDFDISYSKIHFQKLYAKFSPSTFEGSVDTDISGKFLNKNFSMPVAMTINAFSTDPSKKSPDVYNILAHADCSGELFPTAFGVDVSVTKIPDRTDILVNNGRSAAITLSPGGKISASSGKDSVVAFKLNGTIDGRDINMSVTGINAELGEISRYFNIGYVNFKSGQASGAVRITGLTTDPEITGALTAVNPHVVVPVLSDSVMHADKIIFTAGNGMITVPKTLVYSGKGQCDVDCHIILDRTRIGSIELNAKTRGKKYVPADMSFPVIHTRGDAGLDLKLLFEPGLLTLRGSVRAENAVIEAITSVVQTTLSDSDVVRFIPLTKGGNAATRMSLDIDLDLYVGQKVQFLFNPLLRAIIAPDTPLQLYMNTDASSFGLVGDLKLRGGEVVWLNRNFYLKEGLIQFNEIQGKIDPRITIRAETKERDENNNQITIILSSKSQPISTFNPVITSSPAKSEREIMELLGQVVSADSSSAADVAMAGGDFLVQATVIRSIENTLREACNFDIFSIRTNVLQNAVKQTLNQNSNNQQITFGNFFDNSTVYVGKYFGSAMYVDALMHWTYDENKDKDENGVGGIVFQPEFGFEMASPFVNIRLGVAPDMDAIKENMWIPSTSVTLSWKYSF